MDALLRDPQWPSYVAALEEKQRRLRDRLETGHLDPLAMCRLAGELKGLRYALGLPTEIAKSDPQE